MMSSFGIVESADWKVALALLTSIPPEVFGLQPLVGRPLWPAKNLCNLFAHEGPVRAFEKAPWQPATG